MSELKSAALREVLDHELQRGNTIAECADGWSRMDVVVRLTEPIDGEFLNTTCSRYPAVRCFSTRDPHYSGEACGIIDGREGIAGPAAKAQRLERKMNS